MDQKFKKSHKIVENKVFLTEDPDPYKDGSAFRRTKNIWVRRIPVHNTGPKKKIKAHEISTSRRRDEINI
jgi:hypothetical protein